MAGDGAQRTDGSVGCALGNVLLVLVIEISEAVLEHNSTKEGESPSAQRNGTVRGARVIDPRIEIDPFGVAPGVVMPKTPVGQQQMWADGIEKEPAG